MYPSDKSSVNWRLTVVYGCFSCLQCLNSDVFYSAIRTRIQCGETGMETEYCAQHTSDCVPYPPSDSAHWSGSSHCYDKNYVLLEQAKTGATITLISNVVMFVMMPVLSMVADNFGRKKVLVLGFMGTVINGIAMTLAFKGPLRQGFFWMFLGGGFSALLSGGFNGSALAMAADKSSNTIEDRGEAIAVLLRASAVSTTLAFMLGFYILFQNFTDYSSVFATFTLCSLFFTFCACFVLEESLPPADKHEQDSLTKRRRRVSQNFQNGLQILYADKFLIGLVFVVFLCFSAVCGSLSTLGGFLLGHFQYSQAVASLGGIFIQPLRFSGTVLAIHIMKWVGPLRTYSTGVILSVLAFAFQGVCMCFDNLIVSQLVWWNGFFLMGVGTGITDTTMWTIISMRVREEHQSKTQGLVQQSSMAGTALGSFIWGNMIFDPAVEGLAAGRCFLCSSAVCFAALISYLVLWKVTGAIDGADAKGNEWKLLQ